MCQNNQFTRYVQLGSDIWPYYYNILPSIDLQITRERNHVT